MDSNANMKTIEDMLYTARKEVKDNGAFFLLWGWLVFLASISQLLLNWLGFNHNTMMLLTSHGATNVGIEIDSIPWMILMPLGGIVSVIISRKKSKKEKVKTWFDDVMKYLWIAFGVVLFIVLFAMGYHNIMPYPILIALYGLGLFVTGGTLKFKPLIFGGISCWVLSIVSVFVSYEYATLCLAVSVLTGYIIPGYILKRQSEKNDKDKSYVQAA